MIKLKFKYMLYYCLYKADFGYRKNYYLLLLTFLNCKVMAIIKVHTFWLLDKWHYPQKKWNQVALSDFIIYIPAIENSILFD